LPADEIAICREAQDFEMSFSTPHLHERVTYFFIDAGSLRGHLDQASAKLFGGQKFHIDYKKLRIGYTKAFLYDAVPVKKSDESESDYQDRVRSINDELSAAARVDGLHVYTGDLRFRKKKGNEQKKVDILIAVDMLTHAFRRNMDSAVLLTGDLDFKPLLDALGREGMYTTLLYPPGHTNEELINAADASDPITLRMLRGWLKEPSRMAFQIPTTTEIVAPMELGHRAGTWHDYEGWKVELCRRQNEYVVVHSINGRFFMTAWGEFKMLKAVLDETGLMTVPEEETFATKVRQIDIEHGWA
jgi:uncharacterized LabA/DUF88 family protein